MAKSDKVVKKEEYQPVEDLKIAIARKRTDDMIKALGTEVTGMEKQNMYKNVLDSLDDIKYIDSMIKDYVVDNSNKSTRMIKDLKDLKAMLAGKSIKIEEKDYSEFTPVNKVLSGNKGLSEGEITKMERTLPRNFKNMTDEQKQIWEELELRGMVMSCLAYGEDIYSSIDNVSVGKYRGRPYVDEYYDKLGKDVTEEIIRQQELYFENCEVEYNVGEDSEGVTYNSVKEPENSDYVEPTYKEIKLNSVDDLNTIKEGDKVKLKFRYNGKYGRIGKITWWHPYTITDENGNKQLGGVQFEVEFDDGSKSDVQEISLDFDDYPELVTKNLHKITKVIEENKKTEAVEQPENTAMTAPIKNHAHCDECLEDFEYEFDPKNEISNDIEIHQKGNDYAYYAECPNCGNLIEVPAEELDLVVTNVDDITKDGFYMEVMDKPTARKCWYEVWREGEDDWTFDFNQYIFHLDYDNDIIAKMFQEELRNYSEEVWSFASAIIEENKLDDLK